PAAFGKPLGVQLAFAFQFCDVTPETGATQVYDAACTFGARSSPMTIRIVTMKKIAKARLESIGSSRRFAVRLVISRGLNKKCHRRSSAIQAIGREDSIVLQKCVSLLYSRAVPSPGNGLRLKTGLPSVVEQNSWNCGKCNLKSL